MPNGKEHTNRKRKVKDEPIILDEQLIPRLLKIIESANWNYKVNRQQLQQRDHALIAFITLTGVRDSEIGGRPPRPGKRKNGNAYTMPGTEAMRKKQMRNYPTHILIVNHQPLKHGNIRDEIILPKKGLLAPLTAIVEEWFKQLPDNDEACLFPRACVTGELLWERPLVRNRIFYIIHETTGYFPHWFRGVCETIYGKIIFENDAWALKDFMGLKNLDSTSSYVEGQWKRHIRNLYEKKL